MVQHMQRHVYDFAYREAFVGSRRQTRRAGATFQAKLMSHRDMLKTACAQQSREHASVECAKGIYENRG